MRTPRVWGNWLEVIGAPYRRSFSGYGPGALAFTNDKARLYTVHREPEELLDGVVEFGLNLEKYGATPVDLLDLLRAIRESV